MALISIADAESLAARALERAGASAAAAQATARALVYAEAQGTVSHGLSRVAQYAGHMGAGRVDGKATAVVRREQGATLIVDAADGLAFPACALAIDHAMTKARELGVAVAAVTNSYHFGAAIYHLEAIAAAGMVGLAFSNSPAAINAWCGKRPLFGTNPIAAMFPRRGGEPLAIDLALSEVARGKLMVAAKEGKAIPNGWALDEDGQPTTDPARGLKGSMAPAGGVKGAMLALTVELLVTALTGAHFGFEADSFFEVPGNQPKLGQLFLVIDPAAMGGGEVFAERIETLVAAMLADDGVRLPGARRYALARKAASDGLNVADATLAQMRALAGA
ncbi:MAG TPA: Ldh family oxidoreductase [Casimicrobium huifangae]|nr:Ldh family oxidoreductase [Casimicrobium huifangae]